ncbi:MAG TPA: COX15/CtaA family protein [Pyrinomonadaceae bacterium]|nr:COX15/CtaA family protein [Pyrinomonadaceae bacterium]
MNRGLHRFTLFVTCATFVLIVAGALVTSNGAGLAAPDWPLSWGRVFPPMVGNLFYEHGHRLIATSVGLLTIALNVWLWKSEKRLWVRRLGLVALAAVIAQGLLGGLTVKLMLPVWVSSAHACLAQLFFCTLVSLSVFTAPAWSDPRPVIEETDGPSLRPLCVAAFAVTFIQLVLGATLRHSASWDEHLPANLVLAHVLGALLVTLMLGGTLITVLRRHGREAYLARPAMVGAALLALQLGLGLATYLARRASPDAPQPLKPIVTITVAHVACGALVLATIVVLALRVFRQLRPARAAFEVPQAAARTRSRSATI